MQALKSLFFLIFLLSSRLIVAQQDTIYFDEYWEIVDDFNEMVYYRISTNNRVDGKYFIQDYYTNGNLQMEGYSLTEDASVWDGKITWYNSNGSLEKVSNYINGKREGEEINYFPSGTIQSIGINKNDSPWSGKFPMYDQSMEVVEYDNGDPIAIFSFYQDQKTNSEKLIVDSYDPKYNHQFFYDANGNLIAEAEYSIYDSQYEFPIKGTKIYYQYDEDNFAIKPIGKADFKEVSDGIEMTTTLEGYPNKFTGTIGYNFSGQIYFFRSGNLITYQDGERNGITISRINSPEKNLEGIYKDDFPYSGDFYESDPTIINHYENGELNGLQQIFDENNQLVEQANYKDGQYDGDRLTTNDFTGEQYHATYEEGNPINGQVYESIGLTTYKNGVIQERRSYDIGSGKVKSFIVYNTDEDLEILFIEYYRDDETYRLEFKDGLPFNGINFFDESFETYTNGEVTGPYQTKYMDYCENGQYVNNKKQGKVTFKIGSEVYSCLFEDDKPINGVTYDPDYKTTVSYENGQKNGLFSQTDYSYYFDYDSLSMVFENDLPVGKIQYFLKNELVDQGEFKEGLPFDGTFFSNDTATIYLKGELVKKTIVPHSSGYQLVQYFKNGNLNNEVTTYVEDPQIVYELSYKNGKPWDGIQYKKIDWNFRLIGFRNGKQNGLDRKYSFDETPIFKYNYLNGKKDGKQYYYRLDSLVYESEYKTGIPIHGQVVDIDTIATMQVVSFKNKKRIQSEIFYVKAYDSIYEKKAECSYSNNQPFSGYVLLEEDNKFNINKFEDGTLKTTYLETYIGSTVNQIEGFDYGFKVSHLPKQDIVNYFESLPEVIIDYTDENKSSGKATYYEDEDSIGYITFDQFQITDMYIKSVSEWDNKISIFRKTKDNQLISEEFYIEENPNLGLWVRINNELRNPVFMSLYNYKNFVNINKPFLSAEYYDKTISEKPIASFNLKNGRIYSGILLEKESDNKPDVFTFFYFKDGEPIKQEKMTLEEFIKRNKEQ